MATDLLTVVARVGAILFGTYYTFVPIMRLDVLAVDISTIAIGIALLALGFLHPLLMKRKLFKKYYFEIVAALIVAGIAIYILAPTPYTPPID